MGKGPVLAEMRNPSSVSHIRAWTNLHFPVSVLWESLTKRMKMKTGQTELLFKFANITIAEGKAPKSEIEG